MIAKVITWGETRQEAIDRMQRALTEFIISGIKSNIVLHRSILRHPMFTDGSYTTQFLDKNFEMMEPDLFKEVDEHVFVISAAISAYNDRKSKDVRGLNIVSNWKRIGRKIMLRT